MIMCWPFISRIQFIRRSHFEFVLILEHLWLEHPIQSVCRFKEIKNSKNVLIVSKYGQNMNMRSFLPIQDQMRPNAAIITTSDKNYFFLIRKIFNINRFKHRDSMKRILITSIILSNLQNEEALNQRRYSFSYIS